MRATKIILGLCAVVCTQACTSPTHTSKLEGPKVQILNMGPNLAAGMNMQVQYSATVASENKSIKRVEVSQKLAGQNEFVLLQTLPNNPGVFSWTTPSTPQVGVQLKVEAIDNRNDRGSSAQSPLLTIVDPPVLTETYFAGHPAIPGNNGSITYGGACTVGTPVRASLITMGFGDRVTDTAPAIVNNANQTYSIPCVDDGMGHGSWQKVFQVSQMSPSVPYAVYNYIFDQQQIPVSPIGRVWVNDPSVPADSRIAFRGFASDLAWHYSIAFANVQHFLDSADRSNNNINYVPMPAQSSVLSTDTNNVHSDVQDQVAILLGQTSYAGLSNPNAPVSWQFHPLELVQGVGYYIPYYSYSTDWHQYCAYLSTVPQTVADCEALANKADVKVSYPNDAAHPTRIGVHYGSSGNKKLVAYADIDGHNADHSLLLLGAKAVLLDVLNSPFGANANPDAVAAINALPNAGKLGLLVQHTGALGQNLRKSEIHLEVRDDIEFTSFANSLMSNGGNLQNSNFFFDMKVGRGTSIQFMTDRSALNSDPNFLGMTRVSAQIENASGGVNSNGNLNFAVAIQAGKQSGSITWKEEIQQEFDLSVHQDSMNRASFAVQGTVVSELLQLDADIHYNADLGITTVLNDWAISAGFDSAQNTSTGAFFGTGTVKMSAPLGTQFKLYDAAQYLDANGQRIDVRAIKSLNASVISYLGTGDYVGVNSSTSSNAAECMAFDSELISKSPKGSYPFAIIPKVMDPNNPGQFISQCL